MNRACHRHTTGLALPDRRMISAVPQPSAVARMILARQTCFCGALHRLKPTTIFRHDVDDNSCSHDESLNCFGQFGNRPNESDHQVQSCRQGILWSILFCSGWPWILEPSATRLCEPDLHVFAKLFEDSLERGLEAQAFLGVRLAVMTMSWISSSDSLSMSI
jgi:hypothetical protein